MKVALACGGTGGHILPGLATAEVLEERGHQVELWLAGKDGEKRILGDWSGPVVSVPSEGFSHGVSPRSMGTAFKLMRAARTCKSIMKQDRPDVLLGMGSYATVGPVWAAMRLDVPFVLHEANVLPGRAVNLFSRWAAAIAGSFEETRYYLKRKDIVLTGMPMRQSLATAALEEKHHEFDRNRLTILVMGGSRGAHRLNQIVTEAIGTCFTLGHELQVLHLAGQQDEKAVREQYGEYGVPGVVYGYAQDMADIYEATDLAICRSGAATSAELSAFGVPALLVPYPYASKDHQTANARAMEKIGAADVVPEEDLSVAWLKDYIVQHIENPGRLARMSAASKSRSRGRGAEALADLVEQVGMGQARAAAPASRN